MKHTKGPWFANEFAGYWMLLDSDNYDGLDLLNTETTLEAEANAKLAAVAPEMLEILDEMEKAAIALADAAPTEFKNQRNDLFADVHNAHLHAIELIKKAT